MTKDLKEIETNIDTIFNEVVQATYNIPFGNSTFQNEKFILNAAEVPERSLKVIGLALTSKLQTLKETKYTFEKAKIDQEELVYKIEKEENPFEKRRLELDLKRKEESLFYTSKLINDTLYEVSYFYEQFKKLPPITREQFEKAEEQYYLANLTKQAIGMAGPLESLYNMGYVLNQQGQIQKHTDKLLSSEVNQDLLEKKE